MAGNPVSERSLILSRYFSVMIRQYYLGTQKIYTTTGFGPRKNTEMAGVDYLAVYMQFAIKYSSLYIHHPGSAPGVVYIESVVFTAVCIYTTKSSTPAISVFFLCPNPVVVYIFGVPTLYMSGTCSQSAPHGRKGHGPLDHG